MEPTSEQELKQLLDDGKITKEEYQDLQLTLIKKGKAQPIDPEQGGNQTKSARNKLGIIALILVLGGIVFPLIGYFVLEPTTYKTEGSVFEGHFGETLCFLCLGMELPGFVMGVLSWEDRFGKAAAITAGLLFLLSVLFIA